MGIIHSGFCLWVGFTDNKRGIFLGPDRWIHQSHHDILMMSPSAPQAVLKMLTSNCHPLSSCVLEPRSSNKDGDCCRQDKALLSRLSVFSISPSFAGCREPPAKPLRDPGYASASAENDELTLLSDSMQEVIEHRQTHPFDFFQK